MSINNNSPVTLEATVFSNGQIKLPQGLRNELDIHDKDKVMFIRKKDGWMITTHQMNIKSAQEYIRSLMPKDISLVDELIKERRLEAAKECE